MMRKFNFSLLITIFLFTPVQSEQNIIKVPTVKWSVPIEVQLDASPVPYPRDHPDGIIIGTSGCVVRINGAGEIIFKKFFGPEKLRGSNNCEVGLADVNGDGRDDLITESNDGYIYVLDADSGSTLWKYNLGTPLGMFRFATPADLDGDGKIEILAPNMDGWLSCLNSEGKLLWRFKSEPYRISTPLVADINNDEQLEIVFGSSTHHIIALTAEGNLLWDKVITGHDFSRTKPIYSDANRDGILEIYSMSCRRVKDQGLISLNGSDGSLRWTAPMTHKAYFTLAAVDVDQDGIKEILAGDKGTALALFSSNGKLIWRTPVRGRGMWSSPVVADIDGNGEYEILVTVRDNSEDEDQFSWYILNQNGTVLGSFPLKGGGYGAPLVSDIDQDGILEVIIAARNPGNIIAYTFGGSAKKNTVLGSSQLSDHIAPLSFTRTKKSNSNPKKLSRTLTLSSDIIKFGRNTSVVEFKPVFFRAGIEVTVLFPDGSRQIQLFSTQEKPASTRQTFWPIYQTGRYKIRFRLIDLEKNILLGETEKLISCENPAKYLEDEVSNTLEKMNQIRTRILEIHPEGALFIALKTSEIEEKSQYLKRKIQVADKLDAYNQEKLTREIEDFSKNLKLLLDFSILAESQSSLSKKQPIVLWQDVNPWDNEDPLSELPGTLAPLKIDWWAFGNEIESICINISCLAPVAKSIRLIPGILNKIEDSTYNIPASKMTQLHKVVALPSRNGGISFDLLPKWEEDYTITLHPAEIKKIWLNISTKNLTADNYKISWDFISLDAEAISNRLEINLAVSPIRLPDKSKYAANFWSQNKLGNLSTISDLNEHLQTVWYGIPLPAAQANESGAIINEPDWTAHDQIIQNARQIIKILYHYPVTPLFPPGTNVTEKLRLKAQQNYAKQMLLHLQKLGLGYHDFMFYPQDEPGLVGSISNYMKRTQEIKSIDPNFLVYANPTGGISLDMINKMAPVTDVWQPEMDTIELLGKTYLDAMGLGNKPIWTYTAQDNIRILSPLGFYRAQAWFAFKWGLQGGGYWVYFSDDLWATKPEQEPAYGSVAFDGRSIVSSRRWEATRDGIEDYNMLSLLQEVIDKNPDPQIEKVLDEAISYVAPKAVPKIPREAIPPEFDYSRFQKYRKTLRDILEKKLKQN